MAFFLSPHPRREPAFNVPPIVLAILVLLIAAQIARILLPPAVSDDLFIRLVFIPARYAMMAWNSPAALAGGALPFAGYALLQSDWSGLALGCVLILAFGTVIARRFGSLPFLLFFLVCIVTAAAMHLASHWGTFAPLIGLWGPVAGLIAAGVRMIPLDNIYAIESERPLLPIAAPQVLIFSALFIAMNVIPALSTPAGWQASVGTYIAGLFLTDAFEVFSRRRAARLKLRRSHLDKG